MPSAREGGGEEDGDQGAGEEVPHQAPAEAEHVGVIVGPGGVYARMLLSLQRAPLVPVFYGGSQPVQPVGLEELVEALVRIDHPGVVGG